MILIPVTVIHSTDSSFTDPGFDADPSSSSDMERLHLLISTLNSMSERRYGPGRRTLLIKKGARHVSQNS